ncbi:hypothetical protein KY345_01870 [Candidatus Woesearchaeota archaeon]|nr:hypothetical protein [Candidatus Woesearchaeota archaeon]
MAKKSPNQIIGIILLVALALIYLPIPFIDGRGLAALALLGCGLYLLIKG